MRRRRCRMAGKSMAGSTPACRWMPPFATARSSCDACGRPSPLGAGWLRRGRRPGSGRAVRDTTHRGSRRVHSGPAGEGGLMELRILALYPEQMNIYADRGNILFLQRRCEWRGIAFSYAAAGLGEAIDPNAHDLLHIRGGQDRDHRAVAADMVASKSEALAAP